MNNDGNHILYVEDHADTRILMSMMLQEAGFRVTEKTNGEEALEAARAGGFDLYLLDHTYPDVSGVTLCLSIREFDRQTPIVFYSGRALPEEKQAALEAGAQAYLIKPDDLFNVTVHVAEWLEKSRARGSEKIS